MSNLLRRTQARLTKIKVCNPFESTEDIATTDLRVSFEIETVQPIDDLTSAFVTSIPDLVQGAAVESVHFTMCQEGSDVLASFRSNTMARIEECIYSINTAEQEELAFCQDASTPNCVAFQGGIKVFHKKDCPGDIDFAALLALEQGVQTARFISSVNKRLQGFENIVTQVTVVENVSTGLGAPEISSQGTKDLVDGGEKVTGGGFAVIAIAGLLLLLLAAILCMYRRLAPRSQRDVKSITTDSFGEEGENDGAESYASEDFTKLAQQSSKMDVHRCTSALCPVCLSNPDDVHMVTVPKNHPGLASKSYEEYEARDEGVEAIAQEEDFTSSASRRKFNLFSAFRKKDQPAMVESVSFVRSASAVPSLDSLDSENSCEL